MYLAPIMVNLIHHMSLPYTKSYLFLRALCLHFPDKKLNCGHLSSMLFLSAVLLFLALKLHKWVYHCSETLTIIRFYRSVPYTIQSGRSVSADICVWYIYLSLWWIVVVFVYKATDDHQGKCQMLHTYLSCWLYCIFNAFYMKFTCCIKRHLTS